MRYNLLDTLRGLILISMIFYHAIWDLVFEFHMHLPWYQGTPGYLWQQSICYGFILLSGFCYALSRSWLSRLTRGLVILAAGCLVTLTTLWFMPDNLIIFGILFFMGSAMLTLLPLEGLLRQITAWAGLGLSSLFFFLTRNLNKGWLGFERFNLYALPSTWYQHGYPGSFLGFKTREFNSLDYYSLLPWLFLYLSGYFLCRFLLEKSPRYHDPDSQDQLTLPPCFGCGWKPLNQLGRHSLLLYLIHQPLLLLFLSLLFRHTFPR